MFKGGFVYILASKRNGTIYIGVTSNLTKRIEEHRTHVVPGFTSRYRVNNLVWYEQHDTIEQAIVREKQLKEWNRAWKITLIEKGNPNWEDLAESIF